MPRSRDGVSARAHRAATAGASSPTSCRSASMPRTGPAAVDGQAVVVQRDLGAHAHEQVAQRVAGLGGPPRPAGHAHAAAAGHRQHQERRSVGQVGLDGDVDGADRGRRHGPGVRCRTRPRRRARAGTRSSSRCAAATAPGVPRGARSRPRRTPPRRAAAPRRTGSRRRRRSPPTRRAPRPVPVTVNGSVPRPSSSMRHPELAQRVEDAGHRPGAGVRVAVEADRARRQGGHRRDEPHHRAGETAVDGCRRGGGPGRRTSVGPVVSTVGAEGRQRRGHQLGVARAQGPSYDRGPVGQRCQHQSAVGQRLRPGQLDPCVDRAARHRRGPQVEPRCWARLHAPRLLADGLRGEPSLELGLAWPGAWPRGGCHAPRASRARRRRGGPRCRPRRGSARRASRGS